MIVGLAMSLPALTDFSYLKIYKMTVDVTLVFHVPLKDYSQHPAAENSFCKTA